MRTHLFSRVCTLFPVKRSQPNLVGKAKWPEGCGCRAGDRVYSTEGQKVVPGPQPAAKGSGKEKRKWTWSSISNEWKVVGTVAIGIVSWYINAKQDRNQSRMEGQMQLVTRQLKELYGPLYGNRIVAETSYRSAMKEYGGLRNYLAEAKEKKDAEMIKVWRSYVYSVLYPLDMEARDLICNHAHLIAEKEFPEEFERFLEHTAQMQFVMEQWKNDKGKLESTGEFSENDFLEHTNSSGIGGAKPMINYLRTRCRVLRKRQQKYMEDLNVDTLTMKIVNKILK